MAFNKAGDVCMNYISASSGSSQWRFFLRRKVCDGNFEAGNAEHFGQGQSGCSEAARLCPSSPGRGGLE